MTTAQGVRVLDVRAPDGARLRAYLDGPEDAEVTVVLAHAWTLSAQAWQRLATALTTGQPAPGGQQSPTVRVVRYDQRGHGGSDPGDLRTWSIDGLGQDLAAVLEQTAPTGPVLLGGHSMGGMTVMALAAARPEIFGADGDGGLPRVRGVVLCGTSAGRLDARGRRELPLAARLTGHAEAAFFAACARTPELSGRIRDHLPGPDGRLNPAVVQRFLFGPDAPREAVLDAARMIHACPMATVAGWFPPLMAHDKHGALAALRRIPVDVVVGDRDRLTPLAHSRRLAAELPDAVLRIEPAAGHMVTLERPDAALAAVRRQLALLPPA